ncbi:Uncharacterized protein containing caspase domain [Nocardia farcinica]|nr:Uncharacterized protein containing caspase domain [Nocardia farcinica]
MLIGVGAYDHHDRLPNITAAARNVTDLSELLSGPNGTFNSENCESLIDPVSTSRIGEVLDDAAEQASDTLLVYYTGHGVLDSRGRLHLALPHTHPDRIRWTALPFATLREAILESPARTRILILDCCFSGRAFESLSDGPDAVLGQADIEGTYTITSSARNEPSFAPADQPHTAFTAALLAAAVLIPGRRLDDLYTDIQHFLRRRGHPEPQRRAVNTAGDLVLFPESDRVAYTLVHDLLDPFGPFEPTVFSRLNTSRAWTDASRAEAFARSFPDPREQADALEFFAGVLASTDPASTEAIPLYEQTLVERERVLGPDHPDTLAARNNLADAYHSVGRVPETIPLYERILVDSERILGLDHPDTVAACANLATAYRLGRRLDKAIPLYERTLTEAERILGPDHPDTLAARGNLAAAYELGGQPNKARPPSRNDCNAIIVPPGAGGAGGPNGGGGGGAGAGIYHPAIGYMPGSPGQPGGGPMGGGGGGAPGGNGGDGGGGPIPDRPPSA